MGRPCHEAQKLNVTLEFQELYPYIFRFPLHFSCCQSGQNFFLEHSPIRFAFFFSFTQQLIHCRWQLINRTYMTTKGQ